MEEDCAESCRARGVPPAVYIVAPGGLDDRAGIGRLVTSVTRFWCGHDTGPSFRVVDPYGPAVLAIAPLYFARALVTILWDAWRGRIALLHVHMSSKGSVLRKGIIMRLGTRLRLPVIVQLHGTDFDRFYRWLPGFAQQALRRTLGQAHSVLVPGAYWHRVMVDELGLAPSHVQVLPNAVRVPRALPERSQHPGCRILFLGRLTASKGVPELLDALADRRLRDLDWQARLAGPGDVDGVRRRAAALGIGHRVEVSGWVPEIEARRLLGASDIFVLPSHFEGLSMALLEAMAFGLAVIATPVGATEDAIADGVSGVLVPVGDRDALARALGRVTGDAALRGALQANARRRACDLFDIAVHCRHLEGLYGRARAASGKGRTTCAP